MSYFAKFIREPLVQFVLIGGIVFAVYAMTVRQDEQPRDRIVVTDGRVRQITQIFAKTWQRTPTSDELRGLIDAFVKEEVYYREALKLGLDRDDTLIRRRMQQKLEFLTEPAEAELRPTDAELEAYLAANRADFRVEPKIAFQQVFVKVEGERKVAMARASEILSKIKVEGDTVESRQFADPTLLPNSVPLTSLAAIARNFGDAFAGSLLDEPRGAWTGPIPSVYGLHLVRISEFREAYNPSLTEVRKIVENKWRMQKRDAFLKKEYQRLRDSYDIILPSAFASNGATAPPGR